MNNNIFYKILSTPICQHTNKKYKGLYRSEPFPTSFYNKNAMQLWYKYISIYESNSPGITSEMSIEELALLKNIANSAEKELFELICFSESELSSNELLFYGIDVASKGGYSQIGDGIFENYNNSKYFFYNYFDAKYRAILNNRYLFNDFSVANDFANDLREINIMIPNVFEDEVWHIFYIYQVRIK